MDAAEFESWIQGIAALTPLQRRQAWRTLGLSEAASCDGIETCVPAGARIASLGEQAGREEPAAPPPSNLVGADVVAALGQRRIDSIGCPHLRQPPRRALGYHQRHTTLPLRRLPAHVQRPDQNAIGQFTNEG